MTVDDANLEVMDLNYLRLGQARNFVTVSPHYVGLTFCGSQILEPLDRL